MPFLTPKHPPFKPGWKSVSARALNQVREAAPSEMWGGAGASVQSFGDRKVIINDILQKIPGISNYLQQFVVIQEFDDYVACGVFTVPTQDNPDPDADPPEPYEPTTPQVYCSTLGTMGLPPVQFQIVKPYDLQRSPWDGQTVTVNGVDTAYVYTGNGTRTANGIAQNLTINYFPGDVLLAAKVLSPYNQYGYINTTLDSGGSPVTTTLESLGGPDVLNNNASLWLDLNFGAREWQSQATGGFKDVNYFRQIATNPFTSLYAPGLVTGLSGYVCQIAPNQIQGLPFICPKTITIDSLQLWTQLPPLGANDAVGYNNTSTRIAGVGSALRLAIYQATSDTNLWPDQIITQSSSFNTYTASVGYLVEDLSSDPITLNAGTVYWFCANALASIPPTGLVCTLTEGGYYPDATLPNFDAWYYCVTALTASGETSASNVAVAAFNSGLDSASLTWTNYSGNEGYNIYLCQDPGFNTFPVYLVGTVGTNVTSFADAGGTPIIQQLPPSASLIAAPTGISLTTIGGGSYTDGTTFYYAVTALTISGESAPTAIQTAAFSAGNDAATLTWDAYVGATGFNIYISTTSGFTVGTVGLLINVGSTSTTYTDEGPPYNILKLQNAPTPTPFVGATNNLFLFNLLGSSSTEWTQYYGIDVPYSYASFPSTFPAYINGYLVDGVVDDISSPGNEGLHNFVLPVVHVS